MLLDFRRLKIKPKLNVSDWLARPRVKETLCRARGFARLIPACDDGFYQPVGGIGPYGEKEDSRSDTVE
jgi:hypothetical protein